MVGMIKIRINKHRRKRQTGVSNIRKVFGSGLKIDSILERIDISLKQIKALIGRKCR